MTGRATNAMLLHGAAPRGRDQSTGALAVHLGWPAPLHRSSTAPRSCVYGFGVTYSLTYSVLITHRTTCGHKGYSRADMRTLFFKKKL